MAHEIEILIISDIDETLVIIVSHSESARALIIIADLKSKPREYALFVLQEYPWTYKDQDNSSKNQSTKDRNLLTNDY